MPLFLSSTILGSEKSDPTQNPIWRDQAAASGYIDEKRKTAKSASHDYARNTHLSKEEYEMYKGTTAKGGAGSSYLEKSSNPGVDVLLLESSGISHQGVSSRVTSNSRRDIAEGFTQKQDHGASMASLINQISPSARINVQHLDLSIINHFPEAKIINISNNISAESISPYLSDLREKILVKSAGNEQETLSNQGWEEDLIKNTIFAGNLKQNYRKNHSSGRPGNNPRIQDNFLWVVATDIMSASGPRGGNQYSPNSGTSSAAAILSGSVAEIMRRFPEFSSQDVKECLLESAERDFIQTFEDGHQSIHVSDIHTSKNKGIDLYDPSIWGKGILNLHNAILYAKLKIDRKLKIEALEKKITTQAQEPRKAYEHRLESPITESKLNTQLRQIKEENIRELMLKINANQKRKESIRLQKAWLKFKSNVTTSQKPSPLVIDDDKPGFDYKEAEGITKAQAIPDLSTQDEIKQRGVDPSSKGKGINRVKKAPIIALANPSDPRLNGIETGYLLYISQNTAEIGRQKRENYTQSPQNIPQETADKLFELFGDDLFSPIPETNLIRPDIYQRPFTILEIFFIKLQAELNKKRNAEPFFGIWLSGINFQSVFLTKLFERLWEKTGTNHSKQRSLLQSLLSFKSLIDNDAKFLFDDKDELIRKMYECGLFEGTYDCLTTASKNQFLRMHWHETGIYQNSKKLQSIMTDNDFRKLIQSRNEAYGGQGIYYFLSGYFKPLDPDSKERARELVDFFVKYRNEFNNQQEALNDAINAANLFEKDKCTRAEFNEWLIDPFQRLGLNAGSEFDRRGRLKGKKSIFKDELS